jgi:VanZ family protein
MAVIFSLSAQSNPLPEVTTRAWDKLLHVMEYAGLGFLFARALMREGMTWLAALAVAIVLTSGYGASDEWHQASVPQRSSDVHDWIADTIGAGLGAVLYGGFAFATGVRPD